MLKAQPSGDKYPHAARWYRHIDSFRSEFSSLPGDPSKSHTTYGPDSTTGAPPAAAAAASKAADDEDDVDLFGSDEEEDPEEVKAREARLAAYREKKAAKPKPVAKSLVTLDVKPWGAF